MFNLDVLLICLTLFLIWMFYKKNQRNRLPLPPGPAGLPLIGNLLDMPKSSEWEVYHKWSQEFNSDIIHLNAAGTDIIILDTYEATIDLIEKRSNNYSSRPTLSMVRELMGFEFSFAFKDYGDVWRTQRRLMHQEFNSKASLRFYPYQLEATRKMLRRLLDDPDDFFGNVRLYSGDIILSTTYGFKIDSKSDPYILLAEAAVEPAFKALIPGTFLVDLFPILKYVPSWIPGAQFKRDAREWRRRAISLQDTPFADVKRQMGNGTARSSFCSSSLGNVDEQLDLRKQEYDIKSVAGALYTAGADTTLTAVTNCVLALLNYPDVLKKAQEEIDRVIGPGNLLTFEDRSSLPYINAIAKESTRWRDTTPLAVAHFSTAEDEYKGYRIPKGAVVQCNAWAMLHDENVYPDPFQFKPERFLTADGLNMDKPARDPSDIIWGFGRRFAQRCPQLIDGRFFAESSFWIAIASLIAAFDLKKIGNDPEPDYGHMPDIVRLSLPFKCSLRPRSKQVENLIRATEHDGDL
ncbi:cytochrome P450 [Phlegmacium glaucopus]|nr:cytochrome P450 [Phlegmacium glaucopus]